MIKETGGPAFPFTCENYPSEGMSLRDYFASKAMQSINSREDYLDTSAEAIALDAYALADAMLKARAT
jgi:hypothetical protein